MPLTTLPGDHCATVTEPLTLVCMGNCSPHFYTQPKAIQIVLSHSGQSDFHFPSFSCNWKKQNVTHGWPTRWKPKSWSLGNLVLPEEKMPVATGAPSFFFVPGAEMKPCAVVAILNPGGDRQGEDDGWKERRIWPLVAQLGN